MKLVVDYFCTMEINEAILRRMMENTPEWYLRPYYFLQFVIITDFWCQQRIKKLPFRELTLSDAGVNLGTVLHREIGLDIFPYKDFEDLRSRCALDVDLEVELHLAMSNTPEDDELATLLQDIGVNTSIETIQTARDKYNPEQVIEKIRPFIDLQ